MRRAIDLTKYRKQSSCNNFVPIVEELLTSWTDDDDDDDDDDELRMMIRPTVERG